MSVSSVMSRAVFPGRSLPDVAMGTKPHTEGTLDWVGMSEIHQPLRILDGGTAREVDTRIQVFVDLDDARAQGIHMSRLYLMLDQHARTRPLTPAGLKLLLSSLLETHRDLSTRVFIQFDFDFFLRRNALVSEYSGWNSYPVTIKGILSEGQMHVEVGLRVLYSSTCPCSAALARQLIQDQFRQDFSSRNQVSFSEVRAWLGRQESIRATPHSQRSAARLLLRLAEQSDEFGICSLIDMSEEVLETPVQTAVKREDEQAFALRNGQNPMFCEDAARKLKGALGTREDVLDFWLRVEHYESLHAHDAVAIVTKGVHGGYLPIP